MAKNRIKVIQTTYLSPSRTIETTLLSNENNEKVIFIYNFDCNNYRVFFNILDLIDFFNDKNVVFKEFDKEQELDTFLINFKID